MTETTPQASSTWRSTWERWTRGLALGPVLVLVLSTTILILFHENGNSHFFRSHLSKFFGPAHFGSLYPAFYWYGCSFLMLGLVPLLVGRYGLKKPWAAWGIGLGDWRFGLKVALGCYLAFLPVLILVSYDSSFQAKYPLFGGATKTVWHFVLHEGAYAIYFIGWEFIYRGFMLFGLNDELGYYAVFIQTIPFAIMHFGKPQMETLAAVFAGVILGYLALKTRSFWYGWLLHALVAISNDMLAVIHKGGLD